MSELKHFVIGIGKNLETNKPILIATDNEGNARLLNGEVYFKSEADNVIAEKDAEIAQLQAMLEERNRQIGNLDAIAKRNQIAAQTLRKKMNHQKYKRCLDMAYKCAILCQKSKDRYRWAEDENLEHHYNHKIEFFARWHNRWLELSKKFKEA